MKNRFCLFIMAVIAFAAVILVLVCLNRLLQDSPDNINPSGNAYTIEEEVLVEATPAVLAKPTEIPSPEPSSEPTRAPAPEPTPEPTEDPQTLIMEQFYYAPLTEEQKEYITGCSYPDTDEELLITYEDLSYVHILHYDFKGEVTEGELICNNAVAQDFVEIFYELYLNEYPLERVTLIENYGGDDELSMADNNTSCFNYRVVAGRKKLSQHAYGLAIDINPFYNPYITYPKSGGINVAPAGSEAYVDREADFPYKIDENDLCYKLFKEHGFTWGGDWNSSKDYQHFQKAVP